MELKDKIINFLGDSITEGAGVEWAPEKRYDNLLKEKCGIINNNYGIGGTRIAHQIKPSNRPVYDLSFCGRAYTMDKNADIIIVYGGTNDYGHGDAPFGSLNDKTPETYCGGVDFLMNTLKTEYPKAKLLFLAPARRNGDEAPNSAHRGGKALKSYVDVIVEKGKQYGIPVINLYEELGINPNIEADREKYTTDGLHLSVDGHVKLADLVIEYFKKL